MTGPAHPGTGSNVFQDEHIAHDAVDLGTVFEQLACIEALTVDPLEDPADRWPQ